MNSVNSITGCLAQKSLVLDDASSDPGSPALVVGFGQGTFDAEGSEQPGPYFSRTIHWPGGASGVTIGRGYDMGSRTQAQVVRELISAGMDTCDAQRLSQAAGLRGQGAQLFFRRERQNSPLMPLGVQKALFEVVTTAETVADIQRIFKKPDVAAKYGEVSWASLPTPVQEIVFDLRYRGDYTPRTRELIQPLLVAGDTAGLQKVMLDTDLWRGFNVPEGRIRARTEMAQRLEVNTDAERLP
jgi:hypothetical protein